MAIDQALRNGTWPNSRTLAEELEVTRRTVVRDLTFLRDQLRAPIEFDPRRNGYHYSEPTFRLPYLQVSEGELFALYVAEQMLRQFQGTPFEADLRSALDKLSGMLLEEVSIRLDERAEMLSVLPAVQVRYDPDCFRTVLAAVCARRRLEMMYWSRVRNETNRRQLDPYCLALIGDGWHAIGYCHRRAEVRMFAVQRMSEVRETGESFDRPADFRLEEYMKGSFRAMRGEGEYDVVLRFSPGIAGLIAEWHWHSSQVLEPQRDGSLILRLHLNDLREVKRWVMFWGAECSVVAPDELRDLVVSEMSQILRETEAAPIDGNPRRRRKAGATQPPKAAKDRKPKS
jgi:predicted DNA-binding transcriptional regulator YafY